MRPLPRRLKRWTLKLTLALLAGAVVTWAVAWGCALWTPWPRTVEALQPLRGTFAREQASALGMEVKPADQPIMGFRQGSRPGVRAGEWILTQVGFRRGPLGLEEPTQYVVFLYETAFGLPWCALSCRSFVTYDNVARTIRTEGGLGLSLQPRGPLDSTILPLHVMPLGFTLNTLLAAAVILTLAEGAGAWRRRARRKAGKCPWCGYDRAGIVGGDAIACTECGRGA